MNSNQIANARDLATKLPPSVSGLLEFVQSDIRAWQSGTVYDIAYTIDSLMLIEDTLGVLKKARDLLKPRGILVLAEMTAGPFITDKHCEFAWEVDGMISLPPPDEYRAMLEQAGFETIEMQDMTNLAEDCFDRIYAATQQREQEIIDVAGADAQRSWLQLADIYRRCFKERRFNYTLMSAMRSEGEE